jgi:tellurite resistance protein
LDDGREINLKNVKDPILAFSSGGDNITPPPQALNWIKKVYGSVEEIKRNCQVIIYMVHDKVGHLGIFVSGEVARKEHRQILGSMGWLEFLAPGLYEMVVEEAPSRSGGDQFKVRFETRTMEDLLQFDDGISDEIAFKPVEAVSKFNDYLYRNLVSPWVRTVVTVPVARLIRMLHPLRVQRWMVSDLNPALWPVKWASGPVQTFRQPVSEDNPFVALEHLFSESVKTNLNFFRDTRDLFQEWLFQSLYSYPWLQWVFDKSDKEQDAKRAKRAKKEAERVEIAAHQGGYMEACVRIMILVAGADSAMGIKEFKTAERIIQEDPRLRVEKPETYKAIIKEQARIVDTAPETAILALSSLLRTATEQKKAYAIAHRLAYSDGGIGKRESAVLEAIAATLDIPPEDRK